jgi:2,3-dihydroxybenzoate-AMP ligase
MTLDGMTDVPEPFAERYRRAGYWRGETLATLLRPASVAESRVALVTEQRRYSFGELDRWADRLASGFANLGVGSLDRVVVQLPNRPSFVAASVALFRIGAIPVYALANHRHNEVRYLAEQSAAVAYVVPDTHEGFDYRELARKVSSSVSTVRQVVVDGDGEEFASLADIEAAPRQHDGPRPGDPAFLLLSGGTTGLPKLIPRTHDDYAYQLRATAAALDFDAAGVYLASLPVAHNAALGCPGLLGALWVGGTVVMPSSCSPDALLPMVAAEGVTLTTLMPPLALLWLELAPMFGVDVSRMILQVGGAPLSPHNAERIVTELGCRLTHWFGMAEGLLCYTRLDDPPEVVFGTVGRPLCADDEIRLVAEDGSDVGPGRAGELVTRGPYTIRGYFRAGDQNGQAFTDDGFLRTGDLARLTPEGNMVIAGRAKDVIIRGGEKVSAEELEHHLSRLRGVREVAVVGEADELLGERICVVVLPAGGVPTLAEVRGHLRRCGLADYKLPDLVVAAETLPRTNVGKVNKAALRASLQRAS